MNPRQIVENDLWVVDNKIRLYVTNRGISTLDRGVASGRYTPGDHDHIWRTCPNESPHIRSTVERDLAKHSVHSLSLY